MSTSLDVEDYEEEKERKKAKEGKKMKAALAGLGDLWEESQYEDEFNVGTFLSDVGAKEKA